LLIFLGDLVKASIRATNAEWAKVLRKQPRPLGTPGQAQIDWAFYGPDLLLNQDQGIRALLYALNDLLFINADELSLSEWGGSAASDADETAVGEALTSLKKQTKLVEFCKLLANELATYDWRASDAPELDENQSLLKAAFRGSGGYKELRKHVLKHLLTGEKVIADSADEILKIIGD
jgi:hypothetical protein